MNAYELADELQELDSKLHLINLFKSANMLRQQADRIADYEKWEKRWSERVARAENRIAELEKGGEVAGRFYWESVVDGHVMAVPSEGTPHYNKDDFPLYTTPQIKELSDEEITEVLNDENIAEYHQGNWLVLPYAFARAILKKASEK
jgi:hypothetical protein